MAKKKQNSKTSSIEKKAKSRKLSDKLIEYKMNAYIIYGIRDKKKIQLPLSFITELLGTNVDQRWDNPTPSNGSICKNLIKLHKSLEELYGKEEVYHAKLVEVTFKNTMDLMGFDGIDDVRCKFFSS